VVPVDLEEPRGVGRVARDETGGGQGEGGEEPAVAGEKGR
jgi:hypothetical protein